MCDFSGVDEETLVYHILLTHTKPNANGFFVCEDCEYQTNTKENYGNHYKNYHNRCEKIELSSVNDDELKEIKISYERLEKLYHSVLENADKTKAEHELKILQMNDDHVRILKQNEVLQERIEIVYKLGKSYLERSCNLSNNTDRCREDGSNVNEVHKEAEQIEVETTNEGWKSNTLRGFKRKISAPNLDTDSADGPHETDNPSHSKSGWEDRGSDHTRRYCHYFVNTGKCDYEERTKLKCNKTAPLCQFSINCVRQRCMFTYPKPQPKQVTWNISPEALF